MHGGGGDEEVDHCDMIVADLLEPVEGGQEEGKIRYRSLSTNGGEELIIHDSSATIRECPSGLIRRRLTTDFPLTDGFWCEFPNTSRNDGEMQGVCLIGHKNLMFVPDTDWLSYTVTLPFTVKRIFRTSLGLILQRAAPLPSVITHTNFPHLFSLSHPYSEILPIICRNKDAENSSHYVWDCTEVAVLEALNDCQLLLAYSTTARLHSLYLVRKATKSEWKCAASKAESIVSCNTTLTPIGRNSQISTPQMGSQSKHRFCKDESFTDEGLWSTPQTRSVRTRSMTAAAALIQSLPFPTTSPAQRSSVNRSFTDSPIFRLRGGSAHTTPRLNSFCDESIISLIETRGSELDLLAPEICIECVWTERRQQDRETNTPASTAFITQDFIGQMYACFYVAEQKILKCARVKMNDEGRVTTSSLVLIPCLAAANIEGRKMMAVVDLDSIVVIYSGVTRIGALYGKYEFNLKHSPAGMQDEPKRVSSSLSLCAPVVGMRSAFSGHLILEMKKRELVICRLSSATFSSFVAECLSQVCSNLPLDKAMKLSTSWCTGNSSRLLTHYQGNRVAAEVAMFVQFIFTQCGLSINDFPIFREVKLLKSRCDEGICEKKKRMENLSHVGAWQVLKHAFGKSWWRFDWEGNMATECYTVTVDEERSFYQYALSAFSGLHAAYELAKLDTRTNSLLFILASSLHAFARIFGLKSYADYYKKDFPTLSKQSFVVNEEGRKSIQCLLMSARFSPERIPSWHDNLLRFLDFSSHLTSITSSHYFAPIIITIAIGMKRLENLSDVQKVLGKSYDKKLRLSRDNAQKFAEIVNENCSAVEKCEKLSHLFNFTRSSLLDLPPAVALILCELLYSQTTKTLHFLTPTTPTKDHRSLPCEEEVNEVIRSRWKEDLRCNNVLQMLDSQRPIFLPTAAENLPEAELRDAHEQLLQSVSARTVSHCFGRAAIDFRSFSPPLNRPLVVPELNLQGRIHPSNTPFELPQNDTTKSMVEWGSFYNAAAAGLCLGDTNSLHLDCEWLAMSTNNQQGAAAAGLMYAFGLNGHVTNMNLFMIHELLSSGDRLMSIAILLGYAVSRRATADIQMYKMMVTHLPFMMGPTLLELHIDTMIQTAALVALGILFAQSSHLGILGQLVNEIGRPASPDREPSTDRYSYSLAAGFAIGLIALGRGEDLTTGVPFVERYPPLASRLVVLMEGGIRSLCVFPSTSATDLFPLGQTNITSSTQHSNHVRESENVNPHLTASAATIALGFMYLRTGNSWAAESLKIPETLSAIEEIRPDLILLRTLCRHLILWDQIKASKKWVECSVPPIVLNYKKRLFGQDSDENHGNLPTLQAAVDQETIAQTYLNAVAGACFAIALRFASTWNIDAFDTIMYYTMMVLPLDKPNESVKRLRFAAGCTICFNVLCTLIHSLGILMAGSGNLQVLRLCRLLRTRVTIPNSYRDNTSYSTYAAVNTTLGLLMMGRGRYVLKTDDLSLAALVISMFPVSPHNISDNRTYLQPLRMLWVIAAEERLLCPFDADSEEMIELDVEATLRGTKVTFPDVLNFRTPCILPELSSLDKVQISGRDYEKRIFDLRIDSNKQLLEEILRDQHGRMLVNRLGQRKGELLVSTENDDHANRCDPMLGTFGAMDLLGVSGDELSEFNFNLSVDCGSMDTVSTRPDATAYDSWIQRFQIDNGSVAAHDYALSFVKDMLQENPLRFSRSQFEILETFLEKFDQEEEWPESSSVIPIELVSSLV